MHGLILTQSPVISTITFDNKGNIMKFPFFSPKSRIDAANLQTAVNTLAHSSHFLHKTTFGFGTVSSYRGRLFVNDVWRENVLVITSFDFQIQILEQLLEQLHVETPIYLACLSDEQIKNLRPFFKKHGYFSDLENNPKSFFRVGGVQ